MSNRWAVKRVGKQEWPRFVIANENGFWNGTTATTDPRKAVLYAHHDLAIQDCIDLVAEKDEPEPWREGEGEW